MTSLVEVEAPAPAMTSLVETEAPVPAQEEAVAAVEPTQIEAEVVAPAQEPKPKRGLFQFLCCATNKSNAAATPVDEKEKDVPSDESKEGPAEEAADEATTAVVQDAPEAPCCA